MSALNNSQTRIWVPGHRGMVGSAIVRALRGAGFDNLLLVSRDELDLTRQADVEAWVAEHRPQIVVLAAARVGGIAANAAHPVEFLVENALIEINVIRSCAEAGVDRLLFLGSSCIYPRECPQPVRESYLLTGPLEPTNEGYAIAKIAGVRLCQYYRRQYGYEMLSIMPTNLYGPGDNYDLESAHVLPALIRKFEEARVAGNAPVTLWGSGRPRREFLHADDLADACLFLLRQPIERLTHELYNVGWGRDLPIAELALLVQELVGHRGEIHWDTDRPDGTPRKLLDVSRLQELGWTPRIPLREGIARTIEDYRRETGRK
ncbi:MAG: GDP-L-fucose synthase [Candidatus Dadabacteria bacterium]|nr:MAG: GDP-L-fucose synthase [Candidatus Dadabacteria bacterium]